MTLFVFSMTFYIFYVTKLPSKVFEITSIENLSAETLNYLVSIVLGVISYSIPFLSFKMLILLVLFYLTYLAGDIYYLQPILVVFGYKVYKCKIDGGNSVMLITKDDYVGKGKVETYEITKGIYLMRG
ncbi:hypothetical protein HUU53_04745 [Candidatus Micrarchaeota archaeon]|nr:hypothetical protein [Candidatus Micrarchaeota archaeon]